MIYTLLKKLKISITFNRVMVLTSNLEHILLMSKDILLTKACVMMTRQKRKKYFWCSILGLIS